MKNKGILFIIIIIIGVFLIYFKIDNSDRKQPNLEKNDQVKKTYQLEKVADYDHKITQVLDDLIVKDDYLYIIGYNRLEKNGDYFTVYKNGKKIIDINEEVSRNIDTYYIQKDNDYKLIDYKNEGFKIDSYDYLDTLSNGNFIAVKNKKTGIIDSKGNIVLPIKYSEIETIDDSSYATITKDNLKGIIDDSGKVIIPLIYEVKNEYFFTVNNKFYFILKKDDTNYVLNEENKTILKSKNNIYYSDALSKLIVSNNDSFDFYSLDGKLVKNIKIPSSYDYTNFLDRYSNNYNIGTKSLLFMKDKNDSSNIFLIRDDLSYKELKNIYVLDDVYFVSNDFYITKDYNMYDYNDNLIEKYDSIYNIDETDNLIVCKDKKSCGVIGIDGKIKKDYNYEYIYDEDSDFGYLKKDNEYIPYYDLNESFKCDFDFKILNSAYSIKVRDNLYVGSDNNLYNKNCQKVNDKEVRNTYVGPNNVVIAEILDKAIVVDNTDKYDYYLFDHNNKMITYENKDKAIMYLYLGYANDTLFFLTDKGIYKLEV